MTELRTNTATAENRIGIQSDISDTIGASGEGRGATFHDQ
jgi:hypothetical protein